MVKCAYKNCLNTYYNSRLDKILFFSFPKNEDLCNEWIKCCSDEISLKELLTFEVLHKSRKLKICEKHFLISDIIVMNSNKKILKEDAKPIQPNILIDSPSPNAPIADIFQNDIGLLGCISEGSKAGIKRKLEEEEIFPDYDEEMIPKVAKTSVENYKTESDIDILEESVSGTVNESENDESENGSDKNAEAQPFTCSTDTNDLILEASDETLTKVDQAINTEEEYVTDLEKLLRGFQKDYQNLEIEEYKQMLQKFYTQNLRLATRCQKLKAAVEKNQTTTTRILREASKQVNPHQLAFISAQLINNGKAPNKRVWSPQMKNIMVGLFRVSPAAFRFLSKALVLPQEEDINQWINQGTECDLSVEESLAEEGTTENISTIEAQAILDEITFENLMATLL